jgi:hypothetical protein
MLVDRTGASVVAHPDQEMHAVVYAIGAVVEGGLPGRMLPHVYVPPSRIDRTCAGPYG